MEVPCNTHNSLTSKMGVGASGEYASNITHSKHNHFLLLLKTRGKKPQTFLITIAPPSPPREWINNIIKEICPFEQSLEAEKKKTKGWGNVSLPPIQYSIINSNLSSKSQHNSSNPSQLILKHAKYMSPRVMSMILNYSTLVACWFALINFVLWKGRRHSKRNLPLNSRGPSRIAVPQGIPQWPRHSILALGQLLCPLPLHFFRLIFLVIELWENYFDGNQSQRQDEYLIPESWKGANNMEAKWTWLTTKLKWKAYVARLWGEKGRSEASKIKTTPKILGVFQNKTHLEAPFENLVMNLFGSTRAMVKYFSS